MKIIEIRDPALAPEKILHQVRARIEHRMAQGGYGPDPAHLGPEALRAMLAPSAESPLSEFPGLDEALFHLASNTALSEPRFTSGVPVIGPLIVGVRRWWNWMSTKWYVLPILQQQSQINAQVSTVLEGLAQWHMLNAAILTQLQARVADLEARLERLEQR